MSQLNKQVIFITGASSGMGKDAALQLIKEGHIVYGAARRVQQMEDLTKAGGHALPLDVTDENSVKKAVDTIIKNEGRIDVLVNNAGYAVYGAVEDTTLDDARRQYEVNIFGLAAVTKAVLPHMREQHSGKIINISSMGGKMYTPMGAWYHSTKHALEGWSDCLRLELKPFGIDVVIVEPGIIKTEFADVMHQPLLDRSGSGPYAKMANAVAGARKNRMPKGSPRRRR
jgi:short-subunit dehydrogenase